MNQTLKTVNRKKVLLILEWCKKKFGKSKYWKDYPQLRVYRTNGWSIDGDKKGRFGHFIGGKISIFLGKHKTIMELCDTVIHEYKHYLLDEDEFLLEYKKLKKQGYSEKDALTDKHPHENMAIEFANKWGHVCYNELKHELHKRNC
jgi:hypothetical protein